MMLTKKMPPKRMMPMMMNQVNKVVEFSFFSELFVQVCYVRLSNGRVVKASWEKF